MPRGISKHAKVLVEFIEDSHPICQRVADLIRSLDRKLREELDWTKPTTDSWTEEVEQAIRWLHPRTITNQIPPERNQEADLVLLGLMDKKCW